MRLTPFAVRTTLAATLALAAAAPASAQRLTARADLLAALGAGATTEDFEDIAIAGDRIFLTGTPALSGSTATPALPVGSIAPGLAFTNANGIHSLWAAQPRFALRSQAYSAGTSEMDLEFAAGTRAVGFDLLNFSYLNPQFGTITFYGAAGSAVGTIDALLVEGQSTFFGWQSVAAPITRVHVSGFYPSGASSPTIDDVTFAAPVTSTPEPATLALLGGGLALLGVVARRRRSA